MSCLKSDEIEDFTRGDTLSYELTIVDRSSVVQDITGSEIWFSMKKDATDPDSEAVVKVQATIVDATAGRADIYVDEATSLLIPLGRYRYDIVYTNGTVRETLVNALVNVVENVTETTA